MGLASPLGMRHVSDAMVRDVVALTGETSLDAASRLFTLHQISGAPVVDDVGRPLGVVSRSDLLDIERPRSGTPGSRFYYRIWNGDICAVGLLTPQTPTEQPGVVKDVMSAPMVTIGADATVEEAGRIMVDLHVHRLFVLDNGRLVGIVSALDCLRAVLADGARPRPD